jgi:Domain of unknown function (DU1801)
MAYEPKTKKTKASVSKFLDTWPDERRRADGKRLLTIFKEVTSLKPSMWGPSMVGFGTVYYKPARARSDKEYPWPMTGFSPRSSALTLYIFVGFEEYRDLLKKLGKHKTGTSCLYINKLSDVDEKILKILIEKSLQALKKKYRTAA